MGITSQEIARLANVSRSTVSRVINHYPNVPEETRQKVLKVIREYDYHPNEIARALAGKASTEIGLFVLEQRYGGLMASKFIHRMISALVRICYENQSALSVYLVQNEQDFENIKDTYRRKKICGGIFVGFEYKMDWVDALIREGFNMAVVDVDPAEVKSAENAGILVFDNEQAGYMATRHLISLGRKHILHVSGDGRLSSVKRREGYLRAMREAGLENQTMVVEGNFDPATATKEVIKAIRSGAQIDGIFVSSDRMGFGVVHAIREQGLMVPGDIAVIGCDHVDEIANIQEIKLTSIFLPQTELVSTAVKMLLGKQPKEVLTEPVQMVSGETA